MNLYAYVGNDPVGRVDPTGTRELTVGEKKMGANLGLSFDASYGIFSFPDLFMNIGSANATTFPYEMDYANSRYRNDFSIGKASDKVLFYHELYHLFEIGAGIKSWRSMAKDQITRQANYSWNSKLPWSRQNFEARAEAFGLCAGAGQGCSRLEGQSISGGDATLSFKNGTFSLSVTVTGSRIPKVTTFKPPTP